MKNKRHIPELIQALPYVENCVLYNISKKKRFSDNFLCYLIYFH